MYGCIFNPAEKLYFFHNQCQDAPSSLAARTYILLTHAELTLQLVYVFCLPDITSHDVLQDISRSVGWNVEVDEVIQNNGKRFLKDNTTDALEFGAFGVPRYEHA